MTHRWWCLLVFCAPALLGAQTSPGPYARIAVLRPHEGSTVEFESGYIRHLAWHQQARDPWVWYGWTVWAGERQRWFIYATFGHSIASLDDPVSPGDDERDNVQNVVPHAEFMGNALFEFLPALSRGSAVPDPSARMELTTVDLRPGTAAQFESVLASRQGNVRGETLWYRMLAGGSVPRYVRLRPRPSLASLIDGSADPGLPDAVSPLLAKVTVEILTLRPTMSHGLAR